MRELADLHYPTAERIGVPQGRAHPSARHRCAGARAGLPQCQRRPLVWTGRSGAPAQGDQEQHHRLRRALSRRLSAPGRDLHGRQQGSGRRDGALGMGARLLALFERQIPRRRDRGAQRQARPVGGRVRRAATLAPGASTAGAAVVVARDRQEADRIHSRQAQRQAARRDASAATDNQIEGGSDGARTRLRRSPFRNNTSGVALRLHSQRHRLRNLRLAAVAGMPRSKESFSASTLKRGHERLFM